MWPVQGTEWGYRWNATNQKVRKRMWNAWIFNRPRRFFKVTRSAQGVRVKSQQAKVLDRLFKSNRLARNPIWERYGPILNLRKSYYKPTCLFEIPKNWPTWKPAPGNPSLKSNVQTLTVAATSSQEVPYCHLSQHEPRMDHWIDESPNFKFKLIVTRYKNERQKYQQWNILSERTNFVTTVLYNWSPNIYRLIVFLRVLPFTCITFQG